MSSIAPIMRKNSDTIVTFIDPNYNKQKCLVEQHMCLKADASFRKEANKWMDVCLSEECMSLCICCYKVQQSKT